MSENVKNLKRLFGILLLLIAVICLLSVTAFAANPASDFQYSKEGPFVRIDKYVGHSDQVVIPDTIEGKSVKIIGPRAFEGNRNIFSVKMPKELRCIRNDAFAGCNSLKVVIFPESQRRITFDGNVFDRVGSGFFPAKLIIPDYYLTSFPAEGKNVQWLGGHFDVKRMGHHECQDEFPLNDGRCDICGKGMKPAALASTRLGNAVKAAATVGKAVVSAAAKAAPVVEKAVVKNTAKALITTAVVVRSILKLF